VLFPEKKSGLVRLSDTVKSNLLICASITKQLLAFYGGHQAIYEEVRNLALQAHKGDLPLELAENKMNELLKTIPEDESASSLELVAHLHSQSLTAILLCCFTLESYINNLAYFLIGEEDLLGLLKGGHKTSADLVLEAIDRLKAREKWFQIARLANSSGLDKSKYPVQDFGYLFNFRDDTVHDKAVPYSDDRAKKRYNSKLPDPVLSQLTLKHANYAAMVYWAMVEEIHRVISVPLRRFHKHYNLRPWRTDEDLMNIEKLVAQYDKIAADA
jgi:hypothetical protein